MSTANGRGRRKSRKTNINLVFDANDRTQFVSGFRKRNLEKRKRKQEQLEIKLKDERKRIKQGAKESFKKLVGLHRPIPELESYFTNEYETEGATVKITELCTDEISEKKHWIGSNKFQKRDDESAQDSSPESVDADDVPGMAVSENNSLVENDDDVAPSGLSKKEVKKMIKHEATKKIQNSKPFQKKNKLEQIKNKKKSQRMKIKRIKFRNKKSKSRHRISNNKKQD